MNRKSRDLHHTARTDHYLFEFLFVVFFLSFQLLGSFTQTKLFEPRPMSIVGHDFNLITLTIFQTHNAFIVGLLSLDSSLSVFHNSLFS